MVKDWNNLGLAIILSLKSGVCNMYENVLFLLIFETVSTLESILILV